MNDVTDRTLVKDHDGKVRDTMVWHFPHSDFESTIRIGDYKLIRHYDHINDDSTPEYSLFQLYETKKGEARFADRIEKIERTERVDIEEAINIADTQPEKAAEMNRLLTEKLEQMQASYPYFNPLNKDLPGSKTICEVVSHDRAGDQVTVTYKENGAKVVAANLIYTLNGGDKYEEWHRAPAELVDNNTVSVNLPEGTTHYYLNLVDQNRFLVSFPEITEPKNGFTQQALTNE